MKQFFIFSICFMCVQNIWCDERKVLASDIFIENLKTIEGFALTTVQTSNCNIIEEIKMCEEQDMLNIFKPIVLAVSLNQLSIDSAVRKVNLILEEENCYVESDEGFIKASVLSAGFLIGLVLKNIPNSLSEVELLLEKIFESSAFYNLHYGIDSTGDTILELLGNYSKENNIDISGLVIDVMNRVPLLSIHLEKRFSSTDAFAKSSIVKIIKYYISNNKIGEKERELLIAMIFNQSHRTEEDIINMLNVILDSNKLTETDISNITMRALRFQKVYGKNKILDFIVNDKRVGEETFGIVAVKYSGLSMTTLIGHPAASYNVVIGALTRFKREIDGKEIVAIIQRFKHELTEDGLFKLRGHIFKNENLKVGLRQYFEAVLDIKTLSGNLLQLTLYDISEKEEYLSDDDLSVLAKKVNEYPLEIITKYVKDRRLSPRFMSLVNIKNDNNLEKNSSRLRIIDKLIFPDDSFD